VARKPAATRSGRGNQALEFVTIIAVALGLALLIQAFLVKPFRIPSESMEPTLDIGQRVLVDRVSYRFSEPHRGDIVVFKPPAGADNNTCGVPTEPTDGHPCQKETPNKSKSNFIKRVVAVPGDRLMVQNNRVYIDGKEQKEPFIAQNSPCTNLCNLRKEITIPPDHFFMMGDNRGQSADSREWGPVPKKWIIGHAFFTYWPPGRLGTL
jgi:signal peptidase I